MGVELYRQGIYDQSGCVDLLIRRTVAREKKIRTDDDVKVSGWMILQEEVNDAATPILRNFSFALMMTCIGILVILGVIIFCF